MNLRYESEAAAHAAARDRTEADDKSDAAREQAQLERVELEQQVLERHRQLNAITEARIREVVREELASALVIGVSARRLLALRSIAEAKVTASTDCRELVAVFRAIARMEVERG